MRVCAHPGCPELYTERNTYCRTHRRAADKRRGTRQQRGYTSDHDKLRAQWAPKVATGTVRCWRCGHTIPPTGPWQLGHDDHDRTKWRGPEHAHCNLSAAGRKAHRGGG